MNEQQKLSVKRSLMPNCHEHESSSSSNNNKNNNSSQI